MFDWVLTPLAFLHILSLAGAVVFACHRWGVPWRDWPYVTVVLLWVDLVLTAHVAGLSQSMGRLDVYVPVSYGVMAIVIGAWGYVHRLAPAVPLMIPPQLEFAALTHLKTRKFLYAFLIGTLAVFTLVVIVLGNSVYPDNADSMIYRLPRAFWYVSNGSFMHPFDSLDKRITFYPLDGIALYVPLVIYNLPGTMHSYPSQLAWAMLVYTVYRFARALGAERLIALLAAWMVGLTPSILAQSISTNDEILTSVVLLIGLYMGWRWLVSGQRSYFLLAATAVGLSVGTKLHIVFLTPIIAAAIAIALWQVRKKPTLLGTWLKAIGWKTGLLSLLSMILMFTPFLIYNYFSTGRFYNLGDFAGDVFNLRASLRGSLQNLLIYTAQMTLSPIADMNFWPVANDRQHFNAVLNSIFDPLIKPLLDTDQSFYHFSYRFVGITLPVSVRFVEFSLWSAFIWLLWPWQGALALRQKFPMRPLFFLLAITPPLWLVLWSFSTLYMEGTATYFTYYLVCAAPAAVFAFAPIRRHMLNELRWVVVVLVALTSLLISFNLVMYSGFRAIPDLFYARVWPYDWDLFDQRIIDEIRRADRARIVLTHEKTPYFAYMHWHPNARYYSPYPMKELPESGTVLQIYPASSEYEFGFMPLKIPGKATPGMTYLGTIRAIGREAIFASGNGVDQRWPDESNYIIPHVSVQSQNDQHFILMDKDMAGLDEQDNLEFCYELRDGETVVFKRDWDKNPVFAVRVPENPKRHPYGLTLIVRSAWGHKELTRATYQVAGKGSWLPDPGEY